MKVKIVFQGLPIGRETTSGATLKDLLSGKVISECLLYKIPSIKNVKKICGNRNWRFEAHEWSEEAALEI